MAFKTSCWVRRVFLLLATASLALWIWSYSGPSWVYESAESRFVLQPIGGKIRISVVTSRTLVGEQPLSSGGASGEVVRIAGFEFHTGAEYAPADHRGYPPGSDLRQIKVPTYHIKFQFLAIPFWFTTLLLLVWPAWRSAACRWRRAKMRSRAKRGLCPNCGYILAGGATRCPECGYGTGASANPAPGEPQSAAVGRESAGSAADHSAEGL